jgi:hypothetical protein
MADTKPENSRDEVLKRMLKTPPKKHAPLRKERSQSRDKETSVEPAAKDVS